VVPVLSVVTVLSVVVSDEVSEEVTEEDPVELSLAVVGDSVVTAEEELAVVPVEAVVLTTSSVSKTRSQISDSVELHREIQGVPLAAPVTLQT